MWLLPGRLDGTVLPMRRTAEILLATKPIGSKSNPHEYYYATHIQPVVESRL